MDWVDIAAKCNTTAGAASKRYSRMKQAFENGTATMPPVSSAKASGADGKAGVPAKRKRGAGGAENKAATEDSGDDADKEINKDVKKEVKPKPKPKPKRAPVSKKTKTVIKKEVDDGENQDLSDDMPLAEGQDGPDEQINEEPVDIEELKPKRGRVSKKANDNVDVKEKPKPKGAPVSKKTQVKKGSTHPSLTPTLLAELEATVREAHAKHYDSQFDEQLGEPSDGDEMDVNHEREYDLESLNIFSYHMTNSIGINGWLAEIHACDSGN